MGWLGPMLWPLYLISGVLYCIEMMNGDVASQTSSRNILLGGPKLTGEGGGTRAV